MDTFRYVVALVALLGYPVGLAFWLMIHPFISMWRRIGPTLTYATTLATLAVVGGMVYAWRELLLGRDYGTHAPLVVTALVVFAVSMVVELQCRRHLSIRTLVGVPELNDETTSVLLQDGIFARMRHPRYLTRFS